MRLRNAIVLIAITAALLIGADQIKAQSPTIAYLGMDEFSEKLSLHGYGFGPTGMVDINGHRRTIFSWNDSLVVCAMSDSASVSSGTVTLTTGTGNIAHRLLSLVGIYYQRATFPSSPHASTYQQLIWLIRVRCDLLHPSPERVFAMRSCFGSYCATSQDNLSSMQSVTKVSLVLNDDVAYVTADSDKIPCLYVVRKDSAWVLTPELSGKELKNFPATNHTDTSNYTQPSVRLYFIIDSTAKLVGRTGSSTLYGQTTQWVLSDSGSEFLPPNLTEDVHVMRAPATLSVFPNPSTRAISIQLHPMTSPGALLVVDELGQIIASKVIPSTSSRVDLDVSRMHSGIYCASVLLGVEKMSLKFIVQR
jgi:hypothetical protein